MGDKFRRISKQLHQDKGRICNEMGGILEFPNVRGQFVICRNLGGDFDNLPSLFFFFFFWVPLSFSLPNFFFIFSSSLINYLDSFLPFAKQHFCQKCTNCLFLPIPVTQVDGSA